MSWCLCRRPPPAGAGWAGQIDQKVHSFFPCYFGPSGLRSIWEERLKDEAYGSGPDGLAANTPNNFQNSTRAGRHVTSCSSAETSLQFQRRSSINFLFKLKHFRSSVSYSFLIDFDR